MSTKTKQEPFAACGGWASLAEHVRCELREARRARRMAAKDPSAFRSAIDYWDGQIAALVKLRKTFATELKAKPNAAGELQPPANQKR